MSHRFFQGFCLPGASFRPRPMCRQTRHHASHRCFGKLSDAIIWGKHFVGVEKKWFHLPFWGWIYFEFMFWAWRFTKVECWFIWGSLHFTNVDLQVSMTEPSTLKVWIAGMWQVISGKTRGFVGQLWRQNLHLQCQSNVRCLVGNYGNFGVAAHLEKSPSWFVWYIRELLSLKLLNITTENRPNPQRQGWSSNHSFSGAMSMLVLSASIEACCKWSQAPCASTIRRQIQRHDPWRRNTNARIFEIHQPVDEIINLI